VRSPGRGRFGLRLAGSGAGGMAAAGAAVTTFNPGADAGGGRPT
jgi:hypothetical protein